MVFGVLLAPLGLGGCGVGLDTDKHRSADFYLYAVEQGSSGILVMSGDASTGNLETQESFPSSGSNTKLGIDPGGKVLLLGSTFIDSGTSQTNYNLSTYSLDPLGHATWQGTAGQYLGTTYGYPSAWALAPSSGRAHLFTTNGYESTLNYDPASGTIQSLVNPPTLMVLGKSYSQAITHPVTGYVYAAAPAEIQIASPSGGSLAAVPPVLAGVGVTLSFDRVGDQFFAYSTTGSVRAYIGLTASPGSPSAAPTVAFPPNIKRLGVFERGRRVVSVSDNASSGQLTVHSILAASPFVSSVPIASFQAGIDSRDLVVDSITGLVYVSDCASNRIFGYRIHDDGTAEALAGFPKNWSELNCPTSLAIARPPR